MYLRSLNLRHFRNYTEQSVEFTAAKTILLGQNAQGKSNLLEAVELLSALKSHRTSRDRDLIQTDAAAAQIVGQLHRETSGDLELSLTLRANGRRSVALNGVAMRRQVDFLGTLNMVQFSSLDLDLVRGGPECRRHWVDSLLVQLEPIYAHVLQQYNQVLRQRNALLKNLKRENDRAGNLFDRASTSSSTGDSSSNPASDLEASSLSLWDAQLAVAGSRVIRRRARVIQRLIPLAEVWHRSISASTEALTLRYLPNVELIEDSPEVLQQAFLDKIRSRSTAEFHQGTTLVGPHRDDIEFTINQTPARQYGSQGQQRTLVLALKLAELQLIEDVIGEPPLLLLDDVLAELDLTRQNQLLETIQDRFQTIITTTHLGAFDAQWLDASQILYVKAGQLVPEEF
ncbi:DNA replication/repair protein RecF [Alkalinema sp. FACHB-956]|uniref:DNA replication/repair protein RecF n=1 Tax=Alkalinema sp. FACHB-956 TaxID=2692768 RepID=UPI00168858AE|nr:DNA replication/repair protein RecF [Alkalinema sp. FACHB-956]MBD2329057.1 DNA replication/repair protein RecF [Alkalinema sp. FACHB-956]